MRLRRVFAISTVTLLGACNHNPTGTTCELSVETLSGPELHVMFAEPLRVRGCGQRLRSETGRNLTTIRAVLRRVGMVTLEPLFTIPQDRLDALYRDARRFGNEPSDLLSWHRVWLAPGSDVAAAIATLSARPEIEYVYEAPTEMVPPP